VIIAGCGVTYRSAHSRVAAMIKYSRKMCMHMTGIVIPCIHCGFCEQAEGVVTVDKVDACSVVKLPLHVLQGPGK
jgi:hypothetical protein